MPERQISPISSECLRRNPPEIILVFDNYRGEDASQKMLADKTMGARTAVAAKIFHSDIYEGRERPKICCFAGEHIKNGPAGSTLVANYLRGFGIPPSKIITRQNTFTTITDYLQLHSYMNKYAKDGPVAVVTTDDHINRATCEWLNHFQRKSHKNQKAPQTYFIGSSSPELADLSVRNMDLSLLTKIQNGIRLGKDRDINHGPLERLALILAKQPAFIRRVMEPIARRPNHPHMPEQLKRIQKIAKVMKYNRLARVSNSR